MRPRSGTPDGRGSHAVLSSKPERPTGPLRFLSRSAPIASGGACLPPSAACPTCAPVSSSRRCPAACYRPARLPSRWRAGAAGGGLPVARGGRWQVGREKWPCEKWLYMSYTRGASSPSWRLMLLQHDLIGLERCAADATTRIIQKNERAFFTDLTGTIIGGRCDPHVRNVTRLAGSSLRHTLAPSYWEKQQRPGGRDHQAVNARRARFQSRCLPADSHAGV